MKVGTERVAIFPENGKAWGETLLFSALFAAGYMLSCKIYTKGLWSLPQDCYFIPMNAGLAIRFVLMFVLSFFVLCMTRVMQRRIVERSRRKKKEMAAVPAFRAWLLAFAVMFLLWLPYLLSHNPGGIFSDTQSAFREALAMDTEGWHGIYNHNPILYTMIIRGMILISRRFFDGSLQTAVTLLTWFQYLLMCAVMAGLPAFLAKRGASRLFFWGITLFSGLFSLYPLYAVSNWKDTMFGVYIYWYLLCLLEYLYPVKSEREYPGRTWYLWYFASAMLVCFGRNNGKYIVYVITAILFIHALHRWRKAGKLPKSDRRESKREEKRRKKEESFTSHKKRATSLLAELLLLVVIVQGITGPLYDSMDYNRDNTTESVGVIMQQMAAVEYYGGVMTEENEFFMGMLLPEDVIREHHIPMLFDPLKFSDDYITLQSYIIDMYPVRFLKNYLTMFWNNPMICLKAWLLETAGFWTWNIEDDDDVAILGPMENCDYDITQTDYLGRWTGMDARGILNGTVLWKGGGVYFWIMLYTLYVCLCRRDRKGMLILLPGFLLWLTIMAATPIALCLRYIFVLVMYLPVEIVLFFQTGAHPDGLEQT